MKIKIYIVTYKNDSALFECLETLSKSQIPPDVTLETNIINNHSQFNIDEKFKNVNVLHNTLRPDFSTGHLARNWNQAIINGFKDLNNPDCDILVTCQVDTVFTPDWIFKLIEFHKNKCLITACPGDGFVSYTADAIKRIGLWDERFCSIEFQEADFFTRAIIFNKDWSSINDFHHGRILNPILTAEHDFSWVYRKNTDYDTHTISTKWGTHLLKILQSKYNKDPMQIWSDNYFANPPQLMQKLNMLYPYFEKDVIDIESKYNW
jgi:hypothetical protein